MHLRHMVTYVYKMLAKIVITGFPLLPRFATVLPRRLDLFRQLAVYASCTINSDIKQRLKSWGLTTHNVHR